MLRYLFMWLWYYVFISQRLLESECNMDSKIYSPRLVGWHVQGGFHVILNENKQWINLTTGETYAADTHVELPPSGTVTTLTVSQYHGV